MSNIELQKIKNEEKQILTILENKLKFKKEFYRELTENDEEKINNKLKYIYKSLYDIIKKREFLARQRTYNLLMYYVSLKKENKKNKKIT